MTHADRFTLEKIAQRVKLITPHVFRQKIPLPEFSILPLEDATVPPPVDADHSDWDTIPHRSYWGGPNQNFLMRSWFEVPSDWDGNLALHLPLGEAGDIFTHPEGLVYIDGKPIASADRYHHTVPLPAHVHDGQRHQIALHGWTGLSGWPPDPTSNAKLYMETCRLVTRDRPTQYFLWLANAALGTARELLDRRSEKHGILNALDRAFVALDTRVPGSDAFYASVPEALDGLRADLAAAGTPQDVTLHAVGHAHMDIAYLWPVSQMRRKMARTSSNALRLMEEYPAFRFSNSQALLYRFLEEDYPDIFHRIRAAVLRGQWEVMGGMWVEPDVNLAGSEALIRQITLARRYFRHHFGEGVETPVLWLPDTFGFPWCLPQIMDLCGLTWFCTNKLNWNQKNRMPSSTFRWRGIDGTEVTGHVLTTPRTVQYLPFPTNYKSDLSAPEVLGTWETSSAKHAVHDLPICFGYGDGGGGPTEGLIQTAMAYDAMPGMPALKMSTVRAAFEAMDEVRDRLPVWNDELYLEGHRGVLTTNGWIKRANREAEVALHEAEALAAMHGLDADLVKAWELLCLNQFHDILTGTAIAEVFDDAARDYDGVRAATDAVVDQIPKGADHAVSTAPRTVAPVLEVPAGDAPPHAQASGKGALVQMPPLLPYSGCAVADAILPPEGLSVTATDGGAVLENADLRIEINPAGQISALRDKIANRNVMRPGQVGNAIQLFEDRPLVWDAWDIDPFFEDRLEVLDTPATLEIVEDGPVRVALRVSRTFRDSQLTQVIRLTAASRRIDFVTDIDWAERHTLMKVAFPVDVLSPRATYGMQWGSLERPTHRNTSWDAMRFEVTGHGWADLSDGGYGVALLSDCKYGYDIHDDVLRLSLIKSGTMPDTRADAGHHNFTYALLPHGGGWQGLVEDEAAALRHPLRLTGARPVPPPVACDADNVTLETLKPADTVPGFVVRLYEGHRKQGVVAIRLREDVTSVALCDPFEVVQEELRLADGIVEVPLAPFKIVTLLCRTG